MEQNSLLDFTKVYVLENDFVKLTPLGHEHILPLSKVSKDPEIWKFFFEKGDTFKGLSDYVESTIRNREIEKEYPFAVYDKQQKQFAGTTRFYEYSDVLKTIKLGHTWYGKLFRGSGLNKHCKYLLFEFAFEKIEVERIGFGSYIDNTTSVLAMKSVGCKYEGVLRNMFPAINKNGRTDAILMSILKSEWEVSQKNKLKEKLNKIVLDKS